MYKLSNYFILPAEAGAEGDMTEMIQNYLKEIEELRAKLVESESICQQLRRNLARGVGVGGRPSLSLPSPVGPGGDLNGSVGSLIAQAKRDLQKDMEALARGKEALREEKKNGAHEESDRSESEDGGQSSSYVYSFLIISREIKRDLN